MTHEIEKSCRKKSQTTRRALLQAAVGGAGALTVLGLSARHAQAAKISQSAVNYTLTPNGAHICKNCNLFVAPNSCTQVDGVINPAGHCTIGVWKG